MKGVVPVAVEAVPGDRQGGDLVVADLDARGVRIGVEFGVPRQAGLGSRCSIRFPFEVPGGRWQTVIVRPGLGCELGELGLPSAGAIPVGAARVGGDQQSAGRRVGGPPGAVPPAADGSDGERGGVVVGAHVDPAGVRDDVVDAVGHCSAQLAVREVVGVDPHRLASRLPFTAVALEGSDEHRLHGRPL